MKTILYMVILLAVILAPTKGTDVGKLIPVEVVAISDSDGLISVTSDTGDIGHGVTIESAVEDLRASAPGVIYLDTAQYLLLEEGMEVHLDAVERHLKQSVRLCYGKEGISLDGMADFLLVHRPNITLGTVSDYGEIPIIVEENGRYQLIEKT